ncbi:Crp/Fnr family transcriptional regulator [Amycolatopsis sp. CA-230715]|uniref:Crp/Fnr family transcriptional regulator n=1 Tax=Amycolatopsis sp. CA-230715 TaxID=2745196 RepID=UPI001C0255F5|nr:cyclic nucleotide-binding domain-containing protein [Amycolatopsis sp. CA-230715]QWF77935.1 hypothetical protein HUW46_01328 [Amycolatopsis sp. CA-230715]
MRRTDDGWSPQAFFPRLTPAEATAVAGFAREESFAEGERLCVAGEPATRCWLLHSGQINVCTGVPGRGEVVVQTLGPGDVLGLSWLVPPYRWQFGATAAGPGSAAVLDTVRLRAFAAEDPRFGHELVLTLFEALFHRLNATRARLLDLYRNPDA